MANQDSSGDQSLRLQVYLARCGLGSRRSCEKLIERGTVTVNGRLVERQGTRVHPGDAVAVDGKPAELEGEKVYLALHKPTGYLCTQKDPQGRPLAVSLLKPDIPYRVFHVGRLDFLSSGLIFFTNDGSFAGRVSHPSRQTEKEYRVASPKPVSRRMMEDFRRGIRLNGELYRLNRYQLRGKKEVDIVLTEGKNREIRRVFEAFGQPISTLHRIRIGPVCLGELAPGSWRYLTPEERDFFYS